MSERVISIKMPASLVQQLKKLTATHHYIDLSEQLRSVVRQKCLKYSQQDANAALQDIEQQIKENNAERKEQILKELQRLLGGEK